MLVKLHLQIYFLTTTVVHTKYTSSTMAVYFGLVSHYRDTILLLLQSALQPLVGFGLLYDFVPQSFIFTLLPSLDPLLLGQAISVLVFLLLLMNIVPIQSVL